ATPYDSNLKIIGNNVTEKDYEDFITALQNERTGNKLNWSAGQMKPQSDTKAYWHEGQPWMSPATETDDYRKNAGREYAQNIIDDLFYGDENMFVGAALLPGIPKNVVTPVSKSKYKEIHNRAGYTDANAQYIAGVTSVIDPAINSTKNAIEAKEAIELLGKPILDKIPHISGKKMAVLAGIAQTFMDDSTIPSILNTYNNTYVENSSRKQAKQMLDYLEDSDYKYLADFDESREKYIEDLQKEVEKLEETEQLGYLPPGENEIFKEEAINTLKRIIYLNQQYDRFSKIRDKELSDAARLR
ncbi:MAG: hypothetical protein IKU45_04525, partial [Clostridia bacterium]|nr:hypothetical protein [Clostridia bacterium]